MHSNEIVHLRDKNVTLVKHNVLLVSGEWNEKIIETNNGKKVNGEDIGVNQNIDRKTG